VLRRALLSVVASPTLHFECRHFRHLLITNPRGKVNKELQRRFASCRNQMPAIAFKSSPLPASSQTPAAHGAGRLGEGRGAK
jgi:hypothetical protein